MSVAIKKIEHVRSLKIGRGLQYLLDEAYKIFGNPILMHDLDYKLIACTENHVNDDPLWNELKINGKLDLKMLEFLKDESLIDVAANTNTIALLKTDKLKYNRIFGKIYNKENIIVSGIDIIACYKPFEDDDFEAFGALCTKINKEIGRSKHYSIYGSMFQQDLIKRLIEGSLGDKKLYPVHVGIIYNNLKTNLYLGVADISRCDPGFVMLEAFKDLFEKTKPIFKYAIYENHIIMIISSNGMKFNKVRDLGKLNYIFDQNNIYVGISSRFENLFESQKHYNEAVGALKCGIKSGCGRVFQYGETCCPMVAHKERAYDKRMIYQR